MSRKKFDVTVKLSTYREIMKFVARLKVAMNTVAISEV